MAPFFASKHGTLPCADCHKEKTGSFPSGSGTAIVFKGTSSQCASCHKDAHNGTLGTKCESCHNLTIWKNASRAFHKNTIFPLEGRHLTTPCGACHQNGVVKGTPNRCFDCHWIRHKDDKYETRLGNECGDCHRPTSWTAVIWNHAQAHRIRAFRSARDARVPDVPQGQRLHGAVVRSATPATRRTTRDAQPQSRHGGLSDDVRELPQGERPGVGGDLQPRVRASP